MVTESSIVTALLRRNYGGAATDSDLMVDPDSLITP
jgi:hypothetical protein